MAVPTPALMAVRSVSKRFGGHQALAGVDLLLHAAEVHAVAGENGAGKSTLMAVLSGALRPDAGELLWEGRPVPTGDLRAAQELGIAMVHQEPQLVLSLSVAENIALGRLPRHLGPARWVDRAALRSEAAHALTLVSLNVPPARLAQSLSVAERQLVAIARALHFGARLIILDEPTSSLAEAETARLFATLRALRERGTALVYISHRLEELRALADRVTVLRDGRLVLTTALAAITNEALVEAMSGRALLAADAPAASAARDDVALEVRGLTQARRLRGISLRVRRGEIVGLAGLMGSGRSRALRAIFGAERVDEGEVRVRGEDGALRPVARLGDAIAAGVGLVPEDRRAQGLVLMASLQENVGLLTPPAARRSGFLRRGMVRELAQKAVETLRIKTRGLETPVRELSGGNQQKVVLGRWLREDTRVLLLDEPTRGVDVGAKAEIHRHLRALAAQGLGLLVVSSELPELLALCDRLYVMREGAVAGELPRDLATPAEVIRLATGTAA